VLKREIEGIQYLRGLAAVAVVVDHTCGMAVGKYFGTQVLDGLLYQGARGVDLFFLISGFIISTISFRGADLSPSISLADFAERRFARIVPLMWLAILSYAIFRVLGRGTFYPGEYLRALVLFPAGDVQPNQIWTLRHEALFYTLFALSFLCGRRMLWILMLWGISPIIYALMALPTKPDTTVGQFLRILFHPVNIEFLTGFAIGVLWLTRTNAFSFSVPISPTIICLGAITAYMLIGHRLGLSFESPISTGISSLICALILLFGVHVRCHGGLLDRFGRLLGDASYSIYLFHPHVISPLLGFWSRFASQTPITLVIVVTAISAISAGLLIHHYVERPLVAVTRKLLRRDTLIDRPA